MDWCRLGSTYYLDPALVRAGEAAEVLFTRLLAYCAEKETRGRVPKDVLPYLAPMRTKQRTAALLRENVLLDDGQYVIVRSWEKWQEAHDTEAERRRKDRERKAEKRRQEKTSKDSSAERPQTIRAKSARKEVEVEEESSSTEEDDVSRLDVEQICAAVVEAERRKGSKIPTVTAEWRRSARLMLDKDDRALEDVIAVIEWTVDHHFWRANIQSVPTLRKQFDKLRLQREAESSTAKPWSRVPANQAHLPEHERFIAVNQW